jgi:transposase
MPHMKDRHFMRYEPDQSLLLPPNLNDWLPEGHLASFIRDVVSGLDLSAIYEAYADGAKGGRPPCDPRMMTGLLLYACCEGISSSRKVERGTYESIPFRVLAADQHPDHDTICEFRKRHLEALSDLFVQVLDLCREAGLVKLGHVSLDGTKVRANASKHKAMSYGRMKKKRAELEAEVKELMAIADAVDAEEDAKYGKGKRGDELPEELRFRETRLAKIREAMASLEAKAKAEADAKRAEIAEKDKKRREKEERTGKKTPGRKPKAPSEEPADKAQRPRVRTFSGADLPGNFTDPDSRIMKDGATKSFEQCYNAQAAADAESQVIVAADVTQDANDKRQMEPMIEQVKSNTGRTPEEASADSGYFSEDNVKYLEDEDVDAYVATGRMKHGSRPPPPRGRIPKRATVKGRMARKLRTKKGRETYAKRKSSVEPVFGQIKEGRGFRRFLLRGIEAVRAEWRLICLTHNLLKLFGKVRLAPAA